MIPIQLIPLITLVALLFSILTLCKTIRFCYNIKEVKTKRQPLVERSDIFGLMRASLGIVAFWCIYFFGWV